MVHRNCSAGVQWQQASRRTCLLAKSHFSQPNSRDPGVSLRVSCEYQGVSGEQKLGEAPLLKPRFIAKSCPHKAEGRESSSYSNRPWVWQEIVALTEVTDCNRSSGQGRGSQQLLLGLSAHGSTAWLRVFFLLLSYPNRRRWPVSWIQILTESLSLYERNLSPSFFTQCTAKLRTFLLQDTVVTSSWQVFRSD